MGCFAGAVQGWVSLGDCLGGNRCGVLNYLENTSQHTRFTMRKGTVSVRLDEATLERLGAIAKATGRSRGALMTYAIERYAEIEAWQVAAVQEAMDELRRGEADLVEHAQVAAWLASWGTPEESDPPE